MICNAKHTGLTVSVVWLALAPCKTAILQCMVVKPMKEHKSGTTHVTAMCRMAILEHNLVSV
jgi:hypothetical protein